VRTSLRTIILSLCLAAAPAYGQGGAEAFRASWGVLVVPVMDPASVSQVANPALLFELGTSFRIPLDAVPSLSFDPSIDFYWAYYELSPGGRPWPTTVEERTSFVLGLLIDFPVFYRAPPLGPMNFEVGAGLCFHPRFGFSAATDAPAADVAAINEYFWKMGRFFMPSTALRAEYKLTDRVAFGFSARALWPIFNTWTDEGMHFIDQGMLAAGILVRYGLR
jgi:hypothetical protein